MTVLTATFTGEAGDEANVSLPREEKRDAG